MDDVAVLSFGGEDKTIRQFLAQYDAPAYVRRALRVQEQHELLIARCRRQRDEWLSVARIQVGLLQARAGQWAALLPWLENDEQINVLRQLWDLLEPKLRMRVEPTRRARVLSRDLRTLAGSLERFNRRWLTFLNDLDLTVVNGERDAYNRYYVLEKECSIRSVRLASAGFTPLEHISAASLVRVLPTLPVPQLKR